MSDKDLKAIADRLDRISPSLTIAMTSKARALKAAGKDVIGLTGTTTINRQDYGVSWSKTLDNGGLVVSNDVKGNVDLEADKVDTTGEAQVYK